MATVCVLPCVGTCFTELHRTQLRIRIPHLPLSAGRIRRPESRRIVEAFVNEHDSGRLSCSDRGVRCRLRALSRNQLPTIRLLATSSSKKEVDLLPSFPKATSCRRGTSAVLPPSSKYKQSAFNVFKSTTAAAHGTWALDPERKVLVRATRLPSSDHAT